MPEIFRNRPLIDVIAPCGKIMDPALFQDCEKLLHQWGAGITWGKNMIGDHPFLSNSLTKRFEDFKTALDSPSEIIWGYRGGSGAYELLPLLAALTPPITQKVFIGFSDFTALHVFLNQHWQWKSFHGPFVAQLPNHSLEEMSLSSVQKLIQEGFSPREYNLYHTLALSKYNAIAKKQSFSMTAPVAGGNLAVICHGLGTDYQIVTREKILLLEDVNEPAYKVRRMLTHAKQAGIFDGIKALILGEFLTHHKTTSELIENELFEFSEAQSFPVFKTTRVGHGKQNVITPLNLPVKLQTIPN